MMLGAIDISADTRCFTGLVSARSMCSPGPYVTISIATVLSLGLVVFEDVLGVVERQVHDFGVVVIDMDGDLVGRTSGSNGNICAGAGSEMVSNRSAPRAACLKMPRYEGMALVRPRCDVASI